MSMGMTGMPGFGVSGVSAGLSVLSVLSDAAFIRIPFSLLDDMASRLEVLGLESVKRIGSPDKGNAIE